MMIDANMPHLIRHKITQEEIITASKIDGLVIIIIKGKKATRYAHFRLPLPKFMCHMRTWGEVGVIKTKPPIAPILTNNGSSFMFVGCADYHNGN